MFTRVLGIVLGAFLAYIVTKAMNPSFELVAYLEQIAH